MKYAWFAVLTSLLFGCASSTVVVKIPSQPTLQLAQGQQAAKVKVNDLRAPGIAASKREAAFGVPMGNITFSPPEKLLVQDTLELALTQRQQNQGSQPNESYVCEIQEFSVNTNATPLYWDVIGVIRLTLKGNGREQILFGTHTERTYLWPGETIIRKVVEESLRKVVQELDVAPSGARVSSPH